MKLLGQFLLVIFGVWAVLGLVATVVVVACCGLVRRVLRMVGR